MMKGKTDKSVVVTKHKVPTLKDMLLVLIAQNPSLSSDIILAQKIDLTDIKKVLKATTPFIKLLPRDLQGAMNSYLTHQDWKSLYHVNKEWRTSVTASVNLYLNTSSDITSLQQFTASKVNLMVRSLLSAVNNYSQQLSAVRARQRTSQIKAVQQLGHDIPKLTNSLAQLLYFQKKIKEIHKEIEREYMPTAFVGALTFFHHPRNSHLYQIIDRAKEASQIPWLFRILFCIQLAPKHPVNQLFKEAMLGMKAGPAPASITIEDQCPTLGRA